MFKEIVFLSIDGMKKVQPSLDTVVVSILDNSESMSRPTLQGFRGFINLEFEDTYESKRQLGAITLWPDEPTIEEHKVLATKNTERVVTLSDARKIVEFLEKFGTNSEQFKLIVHCYGGISRSAAVAAWASKRFFVPVNSVKTLDHANQRLLRLLDKAWVQITNENSVPIKRRLAP